MNFTQKLQALLADRKQKAVAELAGIHKVTLNTYLKRGKLPSIVIAVRLAKAIGVDVGWLIDDAQGWPPVLSKTPHIPPLPVAESPMPARELRRRARIVAARAEVTGEKQLCPFCGKSLLPRNLVRHVRREHVEELSQKPSSYFETAEDHLLATLTGGRAWKDSCESNSEGNSSPVTGTGTGSNADKSGFGSPSSSESSTR